MSRRQARPGPPEEVAFPVTPMLDMAFQLLAMMSMASRWFGLPANSAKCAVVSKPLG